ncbi:MAG: hypothetical protein R3C60_05200 [Parvularculaceae bacterium]
MKPVHQDDDGGVGQSTCVGIGGDPVRTDFIDVLEMFLADDDTHSIIMTAKLAARPKLTPLGFLSNKVKADGQLSAGVTAPPGLPHGSCGRALFGRE